MAVLSESNPTSDSVYSLVVVSLWLIRDTNKRLWSIEIRWLSFISILPQWFRRKVSSDCKHWPPKNVHFVPSCCTTDRNGRTRIATTMCSLTYRRGTQTHGVFTIVSLFRDFDDSSCAVKSIEDFLASKWCQREEEERCFSNREAETNVNRDFESDKVAWNDSCDWEFRKWS